MKFILEPKVTIVGQTKFQDHPVYKIPPDGDDHTRLGAFAAKGCYDSYGEDGRSCVDNQRAILEHRHASVMEHSMVSMFIEGITRSLTLELNRHRTLAISQRSTRYTEEDDAAMVLEPHYASVFREVHDLDESVTEAEVTEETIWEHVKNADARGLSMETTSLYMSILQSSFDAVYEYVLQVKLLEKMNPNNLSGFELRKWARGKARNSLPHALETRGTWTNNHRGWRWFIESRSDIHAEPEIRRLAYHVWKELVKVAPVYYEDFEIASHYDGIPHLVPKYSKV